MHHIVRLGKLAELAHQSMQLMAKLKSSVAMGLEHGPHLRQHFQLIAHQPINEILGELRRT